MIWLSSSTATVNFSQSSYSANEAAGQLQVTLILSNATSTIITVQVSSSNVSAYGKCHHVWNCASDTKPNKALAFLRGIQWDATKLFKVLMLLSESK